MKKIIAMLLALIMVCSLATVAFADGEDAGTTAPSDVSSITVTKNYNLTNTGTTSPAETFTFTELTCTGIENAGVVDVATGAVVTTANAPVPTIGSVIYAEGDAGKDGSMTKDITITLPSYTAVGIYTYTFSEVNAGVAGVTYYDDPITLVVTVIEQDGKVRVAAVHTEESGENKSDEFANEYSAGTLVISKTVDGNMGDQGKYFDVTVTFASAKPVNAAITLSGGSNSANATSIATTDWTQGEGENAGYTATTTIKVKHGDTVTFTNIPYEVTYTVDEADYTDDGYTATGEVDTATAINAGNINAIVAITNTKNANVDTGVALDSAPYIVMLVVAMAGVVALVAKKRYEV